MLASGNYLPSDAIYWMVVDKVSSILGSVERIRNLPSELSDLVTAHYGKLKVKIRGISIEDELEKNPEYYIVGEIKEIVGKTRIYARAKEGRIIGITKVHYGTFGQRGYFNLDVNISSLEEALRIFKQLGFAEDDFGSFRRFVRPIVESQNDTKSLVYVPYTIKRELITYN